MEWRAGHRDPSQCLESELETTIGLWEEAAAKGEAHFYANSASSAGKFLNLLDRKHSTNPIWRVGRIFRQDGSRWDEQSLRAAQGAAHWHLGAGGYASVWVPVVAAA